MSDLTLPLAKVNAYLAHKQHLLPASWVDDLERAGSDIVALHATVATGPYLSLWARMPSFQLQDLDSALYDRRTMVRLLCMRSTLHLVPSRHMPFFFQAYAGRQATATRLRAASLLPQAGLCEESCASRVLDGLLARVLAALNEKGASTVEELAHSVPELQAKVRHSIGKPYEGEFSLGSRLVPAMCDLGLLVRALPRGTWRSSLYEYAVLSTWLPDVNLGATSPSAARSWLVRRYLSAFGPAAFDDIQWWTGFSKGDTRRALRTVQPELVEVKIAGLESNHYMLADDACRLEQFAPPDPPASFLLPGLDPYIMGYRLRDRFLTGAHRHQVFDRAGNAMPTVWINGCVAGVWVQREDGTVAYRLLGPAADDERASVAHQAQRLERFLDGEVLPLRSHTAFTRELMTSVAS